MPHNLVHILLDKNLQRKCCQYLTEVYEFELQVSKLKTIKCYKQQVIISAQ